MKKKSIKFGEEVEGYPVPVLNEREIRASAGLLFLFMFIALMLILFKGDFLMIKYVLVIFLTDLLIRVFLSPGFSPSLIAGRWIVSSQVPEYVGAAQKKFAWKIGIGLSGLMFILLVLMNSYSIITGVSCLICLSFLFMESAFGICLGCVVYNWFHRQRAAYCPGETCEKPVKQPVQTVSAAQVLMLLGFALSITLVGLLFNGYLSRHPQNLWAILFS
jgi:hypothetical protein